MRPSRAKELLDCAVAEPTLFRSFDVLAILLATSPPTSPEELIHELHSVRAIPDEAERASEQHKLVSGYLMAIFRNSATSCEMLVDFLDAMIERKCGGEQYLTELRHMKVMARPSDPAVTASALKAAVSFFLPPPDETPQATVHRCVWSMPLGQFVSTSATKLLKQFQADQKHADVLPGLRGKLDELPDGDPFNADGGAALAPTQAIQLLKKIEPLQKQLAMLESACSPAFLQDSAAFFKDAKAKVQRNIDAVVGLSSDGFWLGMANALAILTPRLRANAANAEFAPSMKKVLGGHALAESMAPVTPELAAVLSADAKQSAQQLREQRKTLHKHMLRAADELAKSKDPPSKHATSEWMLPLARSSSKVYVAVQDHWSKSLAAAAAKSATVEDAETAAAEPDKGAEKALSCLRIAWKRQAQQKAEQNAKFTVKQGAALP